jgi:aarF domain-containing kinase
MDKKNGHPPKGLFSRSKELVGLAAKLGQKELSQRLSQVVNDNAPLRKIQSQVGQAQALVEALAHLRGAAMKAGQMLSIEARDFLPSEVIDILSQLQDSSESMPFETVQKILLQELGEDIYNELEGLTEKPIASASIGQVHKASFRGQDVALKIQFPGVAESISSDLFLLRKISETFLKLSRKTVPLDALFEELGIILKQEVDYIAEATHMEEYTENLKEHSGFSVPRPIPELVNARVLGMTYENGIKVEAWLKSSPSIELREKIGRKVLDLYVVEFFQKGLVQTDPNFGNFFVRPETETLVLLDFGAMKRYDSVFIREYKQLLRFIREDSPQKILDHAHNMKLLDARESPECKEAFVKMLHMSLEPFETKNQPFDFAWITYSADMRKSSLAFTKLIQYSAPPHQILFLHRKLGGIFRLLQSMEVKIDLQEYWENFVSV